MRFSVAFALAFFWAAAPAMAECDTTIRQSDGYKELSAKLTCLKNEIAELRKLIGAGAGARAAPASGGWTPGACLANDRAQKFKAVITISAQKQAIPLCWSDGAAFGSIEKIEDNFVDLRDPKGRGVSSPGYTVCTYNADCLIRIGEGTVKVVAEKLISSDGLRRARVTIENMPR